MQQDNGKKPRESFSIKDTLKVAVRVVLGALVLVGLVMVWIGYPERDLLVTYLGVAFAGLAGASLIMLLTQNSGLSFGTTNVKKAATVKGNLVRCLNIYDRRTSDSKVEYMEKEKTCPDADYWYYKNDGKWYLVQVWDKNDNKLVAFKLPTEITYRPDRYARILGCDPLRRLKSEKFGILEQIAPFAPVTAMVIGLIMMAVILK